jgi:hypothetical protein
MEDSMKTSNALNRKSIKAPLFSLAVMASFISLATLGQPVDAQSALSQPNTEVAFTPVGLTQSPKPSAIDQSQVMMVALDRPVSTRLTSSPAPRFDMTDAARRYVLLVQEADRMANLAALSPAEIARALSTTSQVSSKGISEGAGAYATFVAANQPEFASGLQTTINLLGREAVIARLKDDPDAFLAMIAGSAQASRNVSGALALSEGKLARAQTVLGDAAYSVQGQNWSQHSVDTQATLSAHRQAAIQPIASSSFDPQSLSGVAADAPVNGRFLLAASYKILGDDTAASELLDKPLGRMCMNRVQLNVRQCLAASQYPYEHLFCLSRHSFGEAATCVKEATK